MRQAVGTVRLAPNCVFCRHELGKIKKNGLWASPPACRHHLVTTNTILLMKTFVKPLGSTPTTNIGISWTGGSHLYLHRLKPHHPLDTNGQVFENQTVKARAPVDNRVSLSTLLFGAETCTPYHWHITSLRSFHAAFKRSLACLWNIASTTETFSTALTQSGWIEQK